MAIATAQALPSTFMPSKITQDSLLFSYSPIPHSFVSRKSKKPCSLSSRAAAGSSISSLVAISAVGFDEPKASVKTLPFRVGHGFDLHRIEPGYPLIMGGIHIPHDKGCEAYSDGDVLLHCVVDAILGALGLPDIGQIFPDSDPKWKGAASSVFIKEAGTRSVLERPKLIPHKEAIRSNLSTLLGADPSVVNLKGKTHEKVDSLGENRSIAAHTVVLLMKK